MKVKSSAGFTLIEALVTLFIFSLIVVTFYSLFTLGMRYIADAKNRLGAVSLANEKMEIVRNIKYDDIGTVGGEIEGYISQDENIVENGRRYAARTLVEYVDDPFDGTGYDDSVWWADYKKVTITISWSGVAGNEEVKLISRFVPPGLEVEHVGDGILSVNIFSDQPGGTGIPNTTVHIVNPETGLDTAKETDNSGNATFMGSNVSNSIQKYQITATKSDYETVNTMPPYPETSYNPIDVHASVVTGSVNVANIVQNKLVVLKVSAIDYLGESLSDIEFHITGGRKIGNQAVSPFDLIYNLDTNEVTASNGEKDFGSVSPGQYSVSLSPSMADYEVIETDPISPFSLLSDQNLNFKIKLADKNATSILIKVLNNSDNSPIPGAQVKLSNSSGYDVTQTASNEGKAFFPVTADLFQSGNYNLSVTAGGFQENNSEATVNINALKIEEIKLISL
ncbi:MAG: prepilin-type N-terminal cleavage/methylation domain-containing protein [bacterium]|nr:prepilin-type N-terminal cleavage/methylation domain-containing protein [bacterium]